MQTPHPARGTGTLVSEGLRTPRLLFLLFVFVIPVLVTAVLVRTFEATASHQAERALAEVRVLHTTAAALIADRTTLRQFLAAKIEADPTLTSVELYVERGGLSRVLAVGEPLASVSLEADGPTRALRSPAETIVFPTSASYERQWDAYRAVSDATDGVYVLRSAHTPSAGDTSLFAYAIPSLALLMLTVTGFLVCGIWVRAETARARRVRAREAALAEEDSLSGTIIHELRAPLTALRGYASLIAEAPEKTVEVAAHAKRISEATDRLVSVITQYADIAHLRSGNETIAVSDIDIAVLCSELVSDHVRDAKERGIALRAVIPDHRIAATTDADRIRQVLTALLGNAIARTSSGSVTLSIFRTPKTVTVRIEDTSEVWTESGAVIGRDASVAAGDPRTALDLYVLQQLVQLLGGSLAIDAVAKTGTTTVLTLPRELPTA